MNSKKKSAVWLCIAIALMIISMIGASLVQTSGGKVTVKKLQFETTVGKDMSALLFKPKWASARIRRL